MDKMKGVVPVGNYKVEVRELPIPEPGEGQVLIDVKCAGICGSDVNTFRMTWEQINERQNLVVGHEAGGIVAKVGPGVKNVKVGDRVTVYHYLGCGTCKYCMEGKYGWCVGKHAYGWHVHGTACEYLVTNAINCCPLPEKLAFENAAFMACSAGTAYASIKKLDSFATDGYLCVIGLGPIGTVVSLMAAAKGWKVIASDLSQTRVDFAKGLGIDAICPTKEMPVKEMLRARMNGKLPMRVMDTSGSPHGLADAIDVADNGAHVVTIGKGRRRFDMTPDFDVSELVVKEIKLEGSWVFTLGEYYEMSDFMLEQGLSFEKLVTGRYSFDEAQKAFEAAADLSNAGKTVFLRP